MTGLYPHSAGVIKNSNPHRANSNLTPDVQTIAEMISDDYLCAYFGKWHLGDDLSAQHGFERWVSVEDGHDNDYPNYHRKEHRFRKSDYYKFLESKGHTPEGDYEGHKSSRSPNAATCLKKTPWPPSSVTTPSSSSASNRSRTGLHPVRDDVRAAPALQRTVERSLRP